MRRAEQLLNVTDHRADVLADIILSKWYQSCQSASFMNCLISELAFWTVFASHEVANQNRFRVSPVMGPDQTLQASTLFQTFYGNEH
jgi:hypothetical protein